MLFARFGIASVALISGLWCMSAFAGEKGFVYADTTTMKTEPDRYTGTILFLGDSTMAAFQNTLATRPAFVVGQTLGVAVDNLGMGGTTSVDMMKSLAHVIGKSDARIVVENFALNDAGFITRDEYAENLRTFVKIVQSAGKIAVLEEPNPVCKSDEQAARLDEYVATLRTVANETKVPLIPQYDALKAKSGWQALLRDCIHPGPVIYQLKAEAQIMALKPLLSSQIATAKSGAELKTR